MKTQTKITIILLAISLIAICIAGCATNEVQNYNFSKCNPTPVVVNSTGAFYTCGNEPYYFLVYTQPDNTTAYVEVNGKFE